MKRSQVTAAAVSGLSLVVVIVVAIGLNLSVIRAGRPSVNVVSAAAPATTTPALPTVVTVYVDDPVPIVVPSNMAVLSSTEPTSRETVASSVSTPSTEADEPVATAVNISANETGPPTATSAVAAPPPAPTLPPATPAPPAPTTSPATTGATTTTRPPSSATTTSAPATLMVFDLPQQAGTADIGVGSNSLTLEGVELAAGWRYSCERPYGQEIQLKMSGPGAARYEFTIKLENGRVFTEGG